MSHIRRGLWAAEFSGFCWVLSLVLGSVLFSARCCAHSAGLAFLGVMVLVLLFGVFGPYPMADGVDGLASVIIFLTAIVFGIRLGIKALTKSGKNRPTSFGSAKWATFDYLTERGLFRETGFALGTFGDKDRRSQLRYSGARHLLTVAPTRSGKGVSSIIPNLLTHVGSALIVDPKGENALITAHRRGEGKTGASAGLKQKIMLLDPWDIAASQLKMPIAAEKLVWYTDSQLSELGMNLHAKSV